MQDYEARRTAQDIDDHDVSAHQSCNEINSEKLMKGSREVVIIHNGERYRLRITSKQRLILTK